MTGATSTSAPMSHRIALAIGPWLVVLGVAVSFIDFVLMRPRGGSGVTARLDPLMWEGMLMAAAGLAAAIWGLGLTSQAPLPRVPSAFWRVESPPQRSLNWRHVRLLLILAVGLVIDVMKPATIAFVIPGARAEYHLSSWQIALWPVIALSGTAAGSLAFGVMADRGGRRAALTVATLAFAATSICGSMPDYPWNLTMCFLMGISAGGFLPLVFSLMAEVMPSQHRGWLSVALGGAGTVGGYLAASTAAAVLAPSFGWRILWFIGLPTAILFLLVIRWIPESPRYLLLHGGEAQARATLAGFGSKLVAVGGPPRGALPATPGSPALGVLLREPHVGGLAMLGLYGTGWGLINFGFLTWLPTMLGASGLSGAATSRLLAASALVALPGVVLVAWGYSRWRTNFTLGVCALGIAAVLALLGGLDAASSLTTRFLIPSIGFLLAGCGGSGAALSVYSAEIFPTEIRASGTGLIAASTKVGGVLGPAAVATIMTASPGLTASSWAMAAPLAMAGIVVWRRGVDTRCRSLEEIGAGRLA